MGAAEHAAGLPGHRFLLDRVCGLKTGGSWSGASAYGLDEAGTLETVGIADWRATRKFRLVSVAASEGSALGEASANESLCDATVQTAKDLQARLEVLSGL